MERVPTSSHYIPLCSLSLPLWMDWGKLCDAVQTALDDASQLDHINFICAVGGLFQNYAFLGRAPRRVVDQITCFKLHSGPPVDSLWIG